MENAWQVCSGGHGAGAGDFTIAGAERHYPPDLEIEPIHLDISLRFHLPAPSVEGRVVITVRSNRSGARKIELHAMDFEDLAVTDGAGGDLEFHYDGRRIRVVWTEPLDKGGTRDLTISYRVNEPVSGLHFSAPDESYPDRAVWAATDHETERARYWLPSVDLPAVRTTLAFHLTAPEAHTALANGLMTGEEKHADGTKTTHWKLDYPCPSYLVCLAVGDFVEFTDQPVDGRPLAYFGARGRVTAEDLRRSFGRTGEIMRWLEGRLGVPFPFPKYYQFALPQFGGAMENISLVSWDDHFVVDEVLEKEIGILVDEINVHEMAHSYFGDAVVIRDFAHAWLKESWATYIQSCWYEDVYGEDEGRYSLFAAARAYMGEADEKYTRPIVTRRFNSSWNMYDRHLYPGGAWRLHMLRRMLGDDVFWPAVTDYLSTYARRTVETEDFRRILEEHSGRSLVRFFDEWIHGAGYPRIKATFAHDSGKGEVSLTLDQTQMPEGEALAKAEAAGQTPEPFSFDLAVAFEIDEGVWERRRIRVEKKKQTFILPPPKAPFQARIDPDGDVLLRLELNPGDKMLRRALRHAPDVVGRILAAEELAKTAKPANLDAVAAAFAGEQFWGVRKAMADAVANSRVARAVPILVSMLASEMDPRVLRAIAAHLGSFRDRRVAEALVALLEGTPSYMVRAAALTSLGAQRDEALMPYLRDEAGGEDYRDIVRNGVLRGLAEMRTEESFEILLAGAGYGREPDGAAPGHALALATAAVHREKRQRAAAIEALTQLLRDPRERVRLAAAGGLATLEAGEAAGAVEAIIPTVPEQTHPAVRRILARLRGGPGDPPAVAKLTKEFERLEEKSRKLEERLDAIEASVNVAAKPPQPGADSQDQGT